MQNNFVRDVVLPLARLNFILWKYCNLFQAKSRPFLSLRFKHAREWAILLIKLKKKSVKILEIELTFIWISLKGSYNKSLSTYKTVNADITNRSQGMVAGHGLTFSSFFTHCFVYLFYLCDRNLVSVQCFIIEPIRFSNTHTASNTIHNFKNQIFHIKTQQNTIGT